MKTVEEVIEYLEGASEQHEYLNKLNPTLSDTTFLKVFIDDLLEWIKS